MRPMAYRFILRLPHKQGGLPDQDFTAVVLGDDPPPGTGQKFLGTSFSGVYYFALMTGAQTALGQPETPSGSGWINFSPTYPPATQQATVGFLNLVSTIGTAIGNTAAHEMGHQLETLGPTLPIFPNMDCGLGYTNPSPPAETIPCDNGDNFAYAFFSGSGFPQTGSTSSGGMFFYGVPGGTSGVPVQTSIHWGSRDIAWLTKWGILPW
jgi:hypothetical protein